MNNIQLSCNTCQYPPFIHKIIILQICLNINKNLYMNKILQYCNAN